MEQDAYLVRRHGSRLERLPVALVRESSAIRALDDAIRQRILHLLHKEDLYPSEMAKRLRMNEQKVYYHVKQLQNAGLIAIVSKEEIRGTVAKRFRASHLNHALILDENWQIDEQLGTREMPKNLARFLDGFSSEGCFSGSIVLGSPDPHGPYKARARDGHYATTLGFFLGQYLHPLGFPVTLDVDFDISTSTENHIIVGGPVTNLALHTINPKLRWKFSDSQPWGIQTATSTHAEDAAGLIARLQNPFTNKGSIIILAGTRFIGTKSAVLALTQFTDKVLEGFKGQKEWYTVVQGYDIDGDGKIDQIERLE